MAAMTTVSPSAKALRACAEESKSVISTFVPTGLGSDGGAEGSETVMFAVAWELEYVGTVVHAPSPLSPRQ
jgi:hypothetical protein